MPTLLRSTDMNPGPERSTVERGLTWGWHAMDDDEKRLWAAAVEALAHSEVAPDDILAGFEADLAALRSGGARPPLSGRS